MPLREVQILLDLVQDGSAPGVDTEMVERELEIRDVGLHLHVEELAGDESGEEEDLLGQGQHQGPKSGDVGFQRIARHAHEFPRQRNSHRAGAVLFLEHAPEAFFVSPLVGPHGVHELVLGPSPLRAFVGEQNRGPAHSENTVGHELGPVVAEVPVQGDVLRGHHDGV